MKRTLSLVVVLAACGGDDRADRPPPSPRPDPKLDAMFNVVVSAGLRAADKARLEHLERQRRYTIEFAVRPPPPPGDIYLDLDRSHPRIIGTLDDPALQVQLTRRDRVVELRYQRGMHDYPSDLVDRQAEVARVAVARCLDERDDVAAAVDRIGTVSMTVRIDHGQDPADVRVVGGHGIESCVQRRVQVLPADGVFLAVVRITR